MNKILSKISMIPGVELCLMVLITMFIPAMSFVDGEKYKTFTIISSIGASSDVEDAKSVLSLLSTFSIIIIVLLVITAVLYLVAGVKEQPMMISVIATIITGAVILMVGFMAYNRMKQATNNPVSTKVGLYIFIISGVLMIIYSVVMIIMPGEEDQEYSRAVQVDTFIQDRMPIDIEAEKFNQQNRIEMNPTVYLEETQYIDSKKIVGISGTFAGASIELNPGEKIMVGRDPSKCQLVLNDSKVSRVHCCISYDVSSMCTEIICYSPNGIKFEDGRTLQKDMKMKITKPERLILANGDEVLEIY